ncbi:efflux RND transporter permease subunit [Undibacterium sp. 5I1]|uniref:efflux RND transporter permease subunit n=1 Tax=unclassified Undibacterium TaxID=2630295 RepID=UPI002AB335AB|nr:MULTISPECIES: efflux RND transporter permease subunit [unclassified Undibacterium]MDY7538905.1 efflux RND transporter permease subunit [Undibacterium sp. 5I1]MEB0231029.1 efflux RND transporter permease subunit [Undibacterium sp. 10I3]MEB0257788.1 efflux RND transporter permease subunit [Undibacterium sp. 5I1]
MWITKVSIQNPVFATMMMVALVVLGLFSYQGLGLEQMPDVQSVGVSIQVQYPGASPEIVENDITKPVESVVNTVSGVKRILASSFEGRATLWVEFQLSVNPDKVLQEVRDKIAQIRPSFPKDVKDPFIVRGGSDGNESPVVEMSVSSPTRSLRELSTLTDQVISKKIQSVPGVGRVDVRGAVVRQVQVKLSPDRMAANNVGVNEVLTAIQVTNQNIPAGLITQGANDQLVRLEAKITDPRGFNKIIVARRANAPVYLEQVADIQDGEREEFSISRVNGVRAISISVTKIQDANIVEVGDGIIDAIADLRSRLPKDVIINVNYNNADSVKQSLSGVKETILEGAALTILIVFLFLHSWRSTVITGLTLPISVIATFIALKAFGFTLNFLTLMALSLCIGLLIDDAIVVRENIVRHLGMGKGHKKAAEDGTNEIGLAVMATTFAIVAVFVPVAFMKGMIGRYFFQFGITVTVAVLVSLFVSFTLDPMLSSVWHDPAEGRFKRLPWLERIMENIEHGIDKLHHLYGRVLQLVLRKRKTTLALAFSLFIGSFFLLPFIGSEFAPETDNSQISLNLKTPVGSSLIYTNEKTIQVEAILKLMPEIVTMTTSVGVDGERNTAQINLKLTEPRISHRKLQKEIESMIRQRLKSVPGIELGVGFNKPIYVAILGPDADKLQGVIDQIMLKIGAIKGIADLESSLTGANPTVLVKVNNELANDLGLSVQQIGSALRPFVAGDTIGQWLAPDGQNYEINVQLPKSGRQKISDLGDLSLASSRIDANGKPIMVPLRQVVQFIPGTSPRVIKRQDLQRRAAIYANVEGRAAGDVGTEVQELVKKIELPPGYRFDVGGQTKEMQDSFNSALAALGIAVIFIYLILASQFGSFLQPLAIMTSLPFSLIGVLFALLITGSTLNIFSIIGFIMLMGLVTKNAILLVDFINQSQRQGMSQYDAILAAGQVRLRPILMTTLAMIFGMLPMAIGLSDGAESQAPMGRAVIGGIITSTLLTLLVVPITYTYLDKWGRRASAYLGRGSKETVTTLSTDPA